MPNAIHGDMNKGFAMFCQILLSSKRIPKTALLHFKNDKKMSNMSIQFSAVQIYKDLSSIPTILSAQITNEGLCNSVTIFYIPRLIILHGISNN